MAVAFDVASATQTFTSGTSKTWSHTCSGSNRLLLVGVSIRSSQKPTGVTYNGVALTRLSQVLDGTTRAVELWYLVNPASGTHNVVLSSSSQGGNILIGSVSYTGVDQVSPFGTVQTNTVGASATSIAVTCSSAAGEVVVSVVYYFFAQANLSSSNTQRYKGQSSSADSGGMSEAPGAASVTMTWTNTVASQMDLIGVPLHAVAPSYRDVHMRINVASTRDIGMRVNAVVVRDVGMRVDALAGRDVPMRVHALARGYVDIQNRVSALASRDVGMRVHGIDPQFRDVKMRVHAIPFASRDVGMRVSAQTARDVGMRVSAVGQGYVDVRNRLQAMVTRDVQMRVHGAVPSTRDVKMRVNAATGHLGTRDVKMRLSAMVKVEWKGLTLNLAKDFKPTDTTITFLNGGDILDSVFGTLPMIIRIGGIGGAGGAGPGGIGDPELVTIVSRVGVTNEFNVTRASPSTYTVFSPVETVQVIHRIVAESHDYTGIARPEVIVRTTENGEAELSFEISTFHPDDWYPNDDETVQVFDEEGPYWSGLLERTEVIREDNGNCKMKITGRGYLETTTGDEYTQVTIPKKLFTSPGPGGGPVGQTPAYLGGGAGQFAGYDPPTGFGWWAAYTPIHTIVNEAIRDLCPFIVNTQQYIIDGGSSILKEYNGVGRNARSIIDDLTALGEADGQSLDWFIWTDADGGAKLHLVRRDRLKIIKVPVSSITNVPLARDTHDRKNKIVVHTAAGVTDAQATARVTRTYQVHLESQIDDLGTGKQLADTLLATASVLQTFGAAPVVVEWPKRVYDVNNVPFPIWRIKGPMLMQLVNDDLTTFEPWTHFPVGLIRIVGTEANYRTMKNSLTLGKFDDTIHANAVYAHGIALPIDSSIHKAPYNLPDQTYPTPFAGGVIPRINSPGADTRNGPSDATNDGDISHFDWDLTTEADSLPVDGHVYDRPIEIGGYVIGFRLKAVSRTRGPVTASITIGHGVKAGYPAWAPITGLGSQNFSAENSKDADLGTANQLKVAPGDFLTAQLTSNSAGNPALAAQGIIITVLYRRTRGSSRLRTSGGGATLTCTASRDATNALIFKVHSTPTPVYAQIEYGKDTTYGMVSSQSLVLSTDPVITVVGASPGIHYRVRGWDADGNESISGDLTA